jgi:hypothetical protein
MLWYRGLQVLLWPRGLQVRHTATLLDDADRPGRRPHVVTGPLILSDRS